MSNGNKGRNIGKGRYPKSKFEKALSSYSAVRRDKKKKRFAHEDLKTQVPRIRTKVLQKEKERQDKLDMERPINKLWTAAGTTRRKWNQRYRRSGRALYDLTH